MREQFSEGKGKLWSGAKLSLGAAVAALAVGCGSGQTSEVQFTPNPASIVNSVDVYAKTGDNDPCNIKGGEWTQEQKDFFLQECKDFLQTEEGQRILKEVVPNIPVVTPIPTRP